MTQTELIAAAFRMYPAIHLIVWKYQLTHGSLPNETQFFEYLNSGDAILKGCWDMMLEEHARGQNECH